MSWHDGKTKYYIEHDDGSKISKSLVDGIPKYLLWIPGEKRPYGPYKAAESAKAKHLKLTQKREKSNESHS